MPAKNPRVLYAHQLYKGPRAPKKRQGSRRPELTIDQILAWADDYHRERGRWPKATSGAVARVIDCTWNAIDNALRKGTRGLPGGSSLAQLLEQERDVTNLQNLPRLSVKQILVWADDYHTRTGRWPTKKDGPVAKGSHETWSVVESALERGTRGLPHGLSLAKVFAQRRGVRNSKALPPLDENAILDWAGRHHARTGDWPNYRDGPIPEAPGETWTAVNHALERGTRGLSGGSTLANLLSDRCGVRNVHGLPPLTEEQILTWADKHRERTGEWPLRSDGPIVDNPSESWSGVSQSLSDGRRGLAGGTSLHLLLLERRGESVSLSYRLRYSKRFEPRRLNPEQILAWADSHFQHTGQWPISRSGPIADAPGETWSAIHNALRNGSRGLPGESSLARFLAERRGVPNRLDVPRLSPELILSWADKHFQRTGKWPTIACGPIADVPGETWSAVNAALGRGSRGLPGGSSLPQLLSQHRRTQSPR